MSHLEPYMPGPAIQAQVQKNGEKWTLILTRDLRHPPEKVWQAITEPRHLREWAPFEADGSLATVGATVNLTWVGTGRVTQAEITLVNAPRELEFGDIRWQLEPLGAGTRLTLWHSIDHRFIAWGAAGWHICYDVLDRLLSGAPLPRIAGPDAMKLAGWKKLTVEYAERLGVEPPKWKSQPSQNS